MAAVALRAFVLAASLAVAAAGGITVNLGLLQISLFPPKCGRVVTIQPGATCQSLAYDNGISLSEFQSLNPLTLCALPLISLVPGSLICTGNTLSFCNDYYVSQPGDTCSSITSSLGSILGLLGSTSCSSLAPNTQLCLAPPVNKCAKDSICGVSISPDLQNLLGFSPDYCSIVSSCEGTLTTNTTGSTPSLTLTLTDATPSVLAVAGSDGHPEIGQFFGLTQQGSALLQVNFVPGGLSDGSNLIDYTIQSSGGSRRKLLGYIYKGGTRTPCCYYH